MPQRMHHLERLSATLGDAVSVDDVARAALTELLQVENVLRAGLAVSQGAGRELSFVSTDEDALGPTKVRWCRIDGLADVPLAHTVRTSNPVYLPTAEELDREFPDLARRQRRLGTQSMASVPMTVDGSAVGGLLLSYRTSQEYSADQQTFLGAVAAIVSQALRRALAFQVQQSTSEQLQRSLMPHSLPELPGLALGAHYRPGGANVDVGGDWYDVMTLPDGSAVVVLGDVMGKGVPAAIVMSEVRSAARAYALLDPDPSLVLERLEMVVSSLPFSDQFVTVAYGLVDPERREMKVAVAGHPPPLLVSAEGRPTLIEATGPALGMGAGPWRTSTIPLEEHATMLFYSNGLVETRRQDLFTGIDLLRDLVERLPARRRNPRELCARLGELMRTSDADDDVTLLAVTAASSQPSESRELPADVSAAGLARAFLGSVLGTWGVEEDVVETAKLCVSELVTNAVIHSGTTSTLTVRADGEYLLVMVQDRGGRGGGSVERAEDLDPEAISGRGLSLVDALVSAWSSEHSTDGTTVWFELPLGPTPASGDPKSDQDVLV